VYVRNSKGWKRCGGKSRRPPNEGIRQTHRGTGSRSNEHDSEIGKNRKRVYGGREGPESISRSRIKRKKKMEKPRVEARERSNTSWVGRRKKKVGKNEFVATGKVGRFARRCGGWSPGENRKEA